VTNKLIFLPSNLFKGNSLKCDRLLYHWPPQEIINKINTMMTATQFGGPIFLLPWLKYIIPDQVRIPRTLHWRCSSLAAVCIKQETTIVSKVTRCVFEKLAQNVVLPIFVNIKTSCMLRVKGSMNVGYLCNFSKNCSKKTIAHWAKIRPIWSP
jgi:hypothetical protein